MTPLAMRVANELILPLRRRSFYDPCNMLKRITEAHCFECTAIFPMMCEMFDVGGKDHITAESMASDMFMPAPVTWLEWKLPEANDRFGLMLVQGGDDERVISRIIACNAEGFYSAAVIDSDRRAFDNRYDGLPDAADYLDFNVGATREMSCVALIMLAIINQQQIIDRHRRQVHAGLRRNLHRALGRYPLLAWEEIKLRVGPPRDASAKASGARVSTEDMPLHFVRAHRRKTLVLRDVVKAHWRGNPALGMKQTRYRMVAPEAPHA